MNKSSWIIALTVLVLSAVQASQADVSDTSLEKSINEAKVLGPDYTVSVKTQGKEVIISTYLNTQSKDMEKDCKIDAVLLAKKAFDLDKQLVRSRILFYKFDRKSYQEVTVTTGDVKAYGSGQISNQELVDSLIVKEFNTNSTESADPNKPGAEKSVQSDGKDTKEVKEAKGETSAAQNETSPAQTKDAKKTIAAIAAAAGAARGAAKTTVPANIGNPSCQIGELFFSYPREWALKTNLKQDPGGERKLAQLLCTNAKDDAVLTLRSHPEDTPDAQVNDDMRFWATHRYGAYEKKHTILFGLGSKYRGLDICVYDREGDRITFERHLYFWTPNRKVYSFELNCNKDEYQKLNTQFNYLISSAVFKKTK